MKRAFTLIELMVVISILAILAALIVPAIHKAKRQHEQEQLLQQAVEKPEPIVTKDSWGNPLHEKITIEGHEYLAVDAMGIVHNENCPCKRK